MLIFRKIFLFPDFLLDLASERDLAKRLSLNPATILRSEPHYYNSYAAFNYRNSRTEYLTEQEYSLLECIAEKDAEIDDLSKEIRMRRQDCEKFLRRMIRRGYVTEKEQTQKRKSYPRLVIDSSLQERSLVPFLSTPASVDVFITNRCNLNCVHCFSEGTSSANELSIEDLRSIFDQLEELRVLEVRINGGEPLLHSEISDVLETLKKRRFRKVLLTNGTLLDNNLATLLKEAEIIPTVSLDGSSAEEHDLFRGVKGSFELTMRSIKILQANGIEYGINCCLHKMNLGKHKEIAVLAEKHGASRIAFLDLKKVGRMKNNLQWIPSYAGYDRALLQLMILKLKLRPKIDVALDTFLHCGPLRESTQDAKRGYVSCQAGKTRLSIDSDGSVYPCNLVLSDRKWSAGNVGESRLLDVWLSQKWRFFRGGVKIADLNKCSGCGNLRRCHDFYCRLLPYTVNGDPFGPHPSCTQDTLIQQP